MTSILIASTLALIAPQPPAAPAGQPQDRQSNAAMKGQSLDGTWTVVSLEKNGQPQPEAKNYTVKANGNTITCTAQDGKSAMTWTVNFLPNGQLRVTEQGQQGGSPATQPGRPADTAGRDGANQKSGVYVLTSDFLAVCLHDSNAANNAIPNDDARSANSAVRDREQASGMPTNKSYCSIVLKRSGGDGNNNR